MNSSHYYLRSRSVWAVVTALVLLLDARLLANDKGGEASPSEKANTQFHAMFGDRERRASETPSANDDTALANELLEAAARLSDDPALAIVLWEKAYALGLRDPSGYPAAMTGISNLIEKGQGNTAIYRSMRLELYRQVHKQSKGTARNDAAHKLAEELLVEGDQLSAAKNLAAASKAYSEAATLLRSVRSHLLEEADTRLREVQGRQSALLRIETLQKRLEADPRNGQLNAEIAEAYLLNLEDPIAAAENGRFHPDVKFRTTLLLAIKPIAELTDAEVFSLARWYATMAKGKADLAGK
jgi:hypothetical protein